MLSSNSSSKYALETTNLSVIYEKTTALWDVNVCVPQKILVAILGPNGAGKSTFIKSVLGLIKPLSGRIDLLGKPVKEARGTIAYVPQKEAVDWNFPITVEELVIMGKYSQRGMLRRFTRSDWQQVEETLEKVGLLDVKKRQISQLSGGQQQRAFIARSLLQEAHVYFMDEPLAGVDHTSEVIIMNLLFELKESGKTIFVVHHDLATVERYFQWALLFNVKLIAAGPLKDVFNAHFLNLAYGKSFALLDEALHLSQGKMTGAI